MPNYEGFDILCLGKMSDSLDAEHINLFNITSIQTLLKSFNLDIISIETPGELDCSIVFENRDKADSALQNLLGCLYNKSQSDESFTGTFQEFLKQNLLSSHMLVMCQSRS